MKRGILFSLTAFALSALLVILFAWNYETPLDESVDVVDLRIRILDRFLDDTDRYVELTLRLGSRATLDAMALWISNTTFINETEREFRSCFLEQVINKTGICPVNENATMQHWMDIYEQRSEKAMRIDFDYQLHNITISQRLPFRIELSLNATIAVNDTYVSWNYTHTYNTSIPAEGLLDPAFWNAFNISQPIKVSPRVETGIWGREGLQLMYDEHQYRSWLNRSPSLLMRYEGDFNASYCCGIETVVNTTYNFTSKGNRSFIDWQIYRNESFDCGNRSAFASVWSIEGFSNETFKLDVIHLLGFNITGLHWSNATCP